MAPFPALFVSHGSPMLAIQDAPARRFLQGLGASLGRPRAILVVSAHWEAGAPTLSLAERPETVHDFGGFPRDLYEIRYPAPGAPDLAREALALLAEAGIEGAGSPAQGLDHGAWVPLMLMYPEADVPVAQLSVQTRLGPGHHFRLGRALKPLRDKGVLVLASGAFTHNLRAYFTQGGEDAPSPPWVAEFADWMAGAIEGNRVEDLLAYRERAPFARENHPTDEHLLPLYLALGAGGKARPLHRSYDRGVLAMDAYAFE